MKKILFEDASNTPSSVLLNSSVYGENIYFSEGCSKNIRQVHKYNES